jgi:TPR repeat protein
MQRDCDGGKQSTCTVLGTLYHLGHVVPEDWDRASALWTKACDAGDANACFRQGDLAYHRRLGLAKPSQQSIDTAQKEGEAAGNVFRARGIALARKQCDEGVAAACEGVARNLDHPWLGGNPDKVVAEALFKRASELVQKGCDAGDREACSRLRSYLIYGSGAPAGVGIPKDVQRGIELTRQACRAGDTLACGESAGLSHRAYVRGEKADLTEPEVFRFYSKACDDGSLSYCSAAAEMLKTGRAVPKDLKTALRLYEKVCFETGEDCNELVELQSPAP